MPSFLERLRQKPEAIRTRYFFFSVGISFLCIALLWIFSLKTSLGSVVQDKNVKTFIEGAQNITENAPVSLDTLIKAGKTLTEPENIFDEKNSAAPENQIKNFLQDTETDSEQKQESVEEGAPTNENPVSETVKEITEENPSSKP